MNAPVTEISMTVPFVTLSSSLRRLTSKSVREVERVQPFCVHSRSSGQIDGPLRPGFASAERILSIRTGRPERIDSTSLCLKCSWPLKDKGVFVESVGAVIVRKMSAGSDHMGPGEGASPILLHLECLVEKLMAHDELTTELNLRCSQFRHCKPLLLRGVVHPDSDEVIFPSEGVMIHHKESGWLRHLLNQPQ